MNENSQRQENAVYTNRYAKKRQTKMIKFDMYLDDPIEKHIYESWQKEENKKQLFIKLYAEHLAKKGLENDK